MVTSRLIFLSSVRNFIFGAEDSLVSTVGLLAGLSAGGMKNADIVLAGIVLIFVEAFSMAVGSFLSEKSIDEIQGQKKEDKPLFDGVVMFFSYIICGLVPLAPYLLAPLFTNAPVGFTLTWSILITLVSLFLLGVVSGNILKTSAMKSAWRMLIIGGAAATLGIVVGIVFKIA